jgi:hypothetical protein
MIPEKRKDSKKVLKNYIKFPEKYMILVLRNQSNQNYKIMTQETIKNK